MKQSLTIQCHVKKETDIPIPPAALFDSLEFRASLHLNHTTVDS